MQSYSGILRDIKAYWGIFRHYWGLWSHNQTYLELCITLTYTTMAYPEPWLIWKLRHLQKPVKHVRWLAHSEPWHSQNSLFKHFQGYLHIIRDIDAYSVKLTDAQVRGRGEASCGLFDSKKVSWVWKVPLWGSFFLCSCQNAYQSALVAHPSLPSPGKFLVAYVHSDIIIFVKRTILNVWQYSEYVCLGSCSVILQQPYGIYCIRHIQNSGIFGTLFCQVYAGILNHIQHH